MISFIKILPYSLKSPSGETFSYLESVTTQTSDPPSLHPQELVLSTPTVCHSPLKRCIEAIKRQEGQQLISLPALREVPFSMQALCNSQEWEEFESRIIRRRFVEAFINNTLLSSRAELEKEAEQILEYCCLHKDISFISHSFRLKLLEAYFGTDGAVFRNPEMLRAYLPEDQQTYEWGTGFTITEETVQNFPK